MNSLVEVLSEYAKTQPEVLLAADAKENITYLDGWNKAIRVAANLKEKYGIQKRDKILVKCNQSVNYLVVYLGCILHGAIFVPIEENASEDRIKDIADEVECKLLVDNKDSPNAVTMNDLLRESTKQYKVSFPKGDDIAEILYTTGTTGKSKGIVLTNRANIALAQNVKYGVNMRAHNVELIPLVMSHSHGLRTFYANLLNGGTVILANGVMNVRGIFHMMETYRVTSLDLSPSAAQVLIKLSKGAFWEKSKNLDYIEIGTAALGEELKAQLVQNLPGVHLYNFYGSTESGRTCVLDFGAVTGKNKCIGKPSRNAKIVFTDDDRNPIETTPDTPGLLASSGPMNMVGYWKNEELTKDVLINGYVCTNDMGYTDSEGYIYITGRRDDVINYNGIKISPSEIEDVVAAYSGIVEAACVGKEDSLAGQVPWLYIVLKNDEFDEEAFYNYLCENIDRTKMPKMIKKLEVLPRTYNGKLNRKELVYM